MATISNTPRPGYVWDATDNVWYPIGTGPHSHADYITSSSAINPNIVDAKGDIITATAADTPARLAVGTNGQYLTANSSAATGLEWTTLSAGGLTLISETVASGLSSLSFSSIPSTYKGLLVRWCGVQAGSSDNTRISWRINNDSGSNYIYQRKTYSGSGVTCGTSTGSNIGENVGLTGPTGTATLANAASGYLYVDNYASTTKVKNFILEVQFYSAFGSDAIGQSALGFWNSTSAITSLDIFRQNGTNTFSNASNTSIRLYGVS